MRSKKADIKRKQIENWNKQQNPRVKPIAEAVKQVLVERQHKQARENIEFRRNTSEREQLIAQGLIKPGKEG